ncbi:MAG: alpha/beta hydrolase [Gorillibacterium sp.]|nr:alpha/beta hydrolase [Gorillibacterium sp.]
MMVHKNSKFSLEDLKILKMKTLCLIGEYDRLSHYPAAIKQLQIHNIPYKIVKNAGHAINHEQPSLVNSEMIQFLLN